MLMIATLGVIVWFYGDLNNISLEKVPELKLLRESVGSMVQYYHFSSGFRRLTDDDLIRQGSLL